MSEKKILRVIMYKSLVLQVSGKQYKPKQYHEKGYQNKTEGIILLLHVTLVLPHWNTGQDLLSASQEGWTRVKADMEETNQNDQAAALQEKP